MVHRVAIQLQTGVLNADTGRFMFSPEHSLLTRAETGHANNVVFRV